MSQMEQAETGMKQFFVCQVFEVRTRGGMSSIQLLEAFHLRNMHDAVCKAERMNDAKHIVGTIAYSIFVDEEAGEYSEMQDIQRFGSVPDPDLE